MSANINVHLLVLPLLYAREGYFLAFSKTSTISLIDFCWSLPCIAWETCSCKWPLRMMLSTARRADCTAKDCCKISMQYFSPSICLITCSKWPFADFNLLRAFALTAFCIYISYPTLLGRVMSTQYIIFQNFQLNNDVAESCITGSTLYVSSNF